MGKRKNATGTYGKTASVGVTLSLGLIDKLDSRVEEGDFSSRSELIESACETYLSLQKCPQCGALNPKEGLKCSVCGTDLIQGIREIIQNSIFIEVFDIFSGIYKNSEEFCNTDEKHQKEILYNELINGNNNIKKLFQLLKRDSSMKYIDSIFDKLKGDIELQK